MLITGIFTIIYLVLFVFCKVKYTEARITPGKNINIGVYKYLIILFGVATIILFIMFSINLLEYLSEVKL